MCAELQRVLVLGPVNIIFRLNLRTEGRKPYAVIRYMNTELD